MKNLKMFAIAVMAFAVMATGVHALSCEDGSKFSILTDNDELKCFTTLAAAMSDPDSATGVIKLEEAYQSNADITITQNTTIDLNGKNIKIAGNHGIKVNSGKLTLKGAGTVENTKSADQSLIAVAAGASLEVLDSVKLVNNENSTTDAAAVRVASNTTGATNMTITFGEGVTVTSKLHGLVVGDSSSNTNATKTEINMNGTWTADAYVVKVNGYIAYQATNPVKVNVPAGTYTSNGATALYASGYAEWDIKNPTVKGAQAIAVRTGKVTIENGTYEATAVANGAGVHDGDKNYAIAILGNENNVDGASYGTGHINVTIAKGSFTANAKDAYAVYVGTIDSADSLTINGGTFTSGKDADNNQLPAMLISETGADVILTNHNFMVTKGTFVGGLVGEVTNEGVKYSAEEFTAELVNGEISTPEAQKPAEGEGENQGNTENNGSESQGNQGPTDNVKNPETNDNILVYAGLGLVSLASVAFTAKKRED